MQQKANLTLFIFLLAFCSVYSTQSFGQSSDTAADHLGSLAFLAGGTWHSSSKWPDGTPFEVEIKYFWGPTMKALHFETYEPSVGKSVLIYEGLLYYDPNRNEIIQLNIKPGGEVNEYETKPISKDAFEVMGAKTKSIVRHTAENEFVWELYVPDGNEWKQILTAKHFRTF